MSKDKSQKSGMLDPKRLQPDGLGRKSSLFSPESFHEDQLRKKEMNRSFVTMAQHSDVDTSGYAPRRPKVRYENTYRIEPERKFSSLTRSLMICDSVRESCLQALASYFSSFRYSSRTWIWWWLLPRLGWTFFLVLCGTCFRIELSVVWERNRSCQRLSAAPWSRNCDSSPSFSAGLRGSSLARTSWTCVPVHLAEDVWGPASRSFGSCL